MKWVRASQIKRSTGFSSISIITVDLGHKSPFLSFIFEFKLKTSFLPFFSFRLRFEEKVLEEVGLDAHHEVFCPVLKNKHGLIFKAGKIFHEILI